MFERDIKGNYLIPLSCVWEGKIVDVCPSHTSTHRSYKKLLKAVKGLPTLQKRVIINLYGLFNIKAKGLLEVSRGLRISKQAVYSAKRKGLKNLGVTLKTSK